MAEQHRTEPPTPRRLRKARREGDHPISHVLIAAAALAGAALALPYAARGVASDARQLWQLAAAGPRGIDAIVLAERVAVRTLPIVLASALGALAVGLWQTGGAVSFAALGFGARRASPWSLSWRFDARARVLGCVRSALAALALAWAGTRLLSEQGLGFARSIGDARSALSLALELGQGLLAWALGVLIVTGALDAFIARAAWLKRLRMTREEVQRELKESEGDPGLKQARRRAHEELTKSADVSAVGAAALLVVGRGSISTALAYTPGRDTAPLVLMHASGALAKAVEAEATLRGVAIVEDEALAKALSRLRVDEEIPVEHYAAVADAMSGRGRAAPSRHPSTL